eukprot:Rhum_TRINITY_DN14433_c14_g1::Rhum_TRINITY_DN14433_c14_g1_i1::g.91273::m.91273
MVANKPSRNGGDSERPETGKKGGKGGKKGGKGDRKGDRGDRAPKKEEAVKEEVEKKETNKVVYFATGAVTESKPVGAVGSWADLARSTKEVPKPAPKKPAPAPKVEEKVAEPEPEPVAEVAPVVEEPEAPAAPVEPAAPTPEPVVEAKVEEPAADEWPAPPAAEPVVEAPKVQEKPKVVEAPVAAPVAPAAAAAAAAAAAPLQAAAKNILFEAPDVTKAKDARVSKKFSEQSESVVLPPSFSASAASYANISFGAGDVEPPMPVAPSSAAPAAPMAMHHHTSHLQHAVPQVSMLPQTQHVDKERCDRDGWQSSSYAGVDVLPTTHTSGGSSWASPPVPKQHQHPSAQTFKQPAMLSGGGLQQQGGSRYYPQGGRQGKGGRQNTTQSSRQYSGQQYGMASQSQSYGGQQSGNMFYPSSGLSSMGGSAQYPASATSAYGATSYLSNQGAPQQQFSSYGNQNRDQVYPQMHQPATQQRYQQQTSYPVQRTQVTSGMSAGYGQQYGSNAQQYSRESGSSLSGGGASYMGGSRQTDFSQFNLPSAGGR